MVGPAPSIPIVRSGNAVLLQDNEVTIDSTLLRKKPPAGKPDSGLHLASGVLDWREAPRAFYLRETVEVARDLIGAWLVRVHRGRPYGARIVETEAYLGLSDRAAHTWGGRRTPRVEPMYLEGGHLYVFLVYGMHCCANIVTGPEGTGEAVLIRAAEGPAGSPVRMLAGPGRFCSALGIKTAHSGRDLLRDKEFRLFMRKGPPPDLGNTARIGVDYAGEARDWALRFFDKTSLSVSGPGRLRR